MRVIAGEARGRSLEAPGFSCIRQHDQLHGPPCLRGRQISGLQARRHLKEKEAQSSLRTVLSLWIRN